MRGWSGPACLLVWFGLAGCPAEPKAPSTPATCEAGPTLFGRPEAATGLTDAECGPACTCAGETWEAPAYTDAEVAALRATTLTTPFDEVSEDPYLTLVPDEESDETVCAFLGDTSDTYRVETFATAGDATRAGGVVTHAGGCGVCSTLTDLAVYISVNDLTAPARDCGLEHAGGPAADHVACLQDIGFTLPCAQIWYWNTLHTQDVCLVECLAALDDPYNQPDGSLNPCLQCDEDESGPVFKAVAGRTRRNTGLPNAICRPCEDVRPIEHRYP